jgi:hypothetical protein
MRGAEANFLISMAISRLRSNFLRDGFGMLHQSRKEIMPQVEEGGEDF